MTDIFISYSHRDERFARRLAESLSLAGIDVWIDVDDIPVGMKWSTAIMQGLKLCQIMIVLISPDSMKSRNVEDEWQYFLDKGKPVVPVLLRPAEIHFQLNRIQRIDFYSEDYDTALQYLFLELESRGAALATGTIIARPTIIGRRPDTLPPKKKLRRSGLRPAVLLALVFFLIAGGLLLVLRLTGGSGGGATVTLNATDQFETLVALDHPATTPGVVASITVAPTLTSAVEASATSTLASDLTITATAAASATPTGTATSSAAVTMTADNPVNVRSGDDPEQTLVGTLHRGQQADVLGINRFKTWYFIEFTDSQTGTVRRGWVSAPFVTTSGDATTLPTLDLNSASMLP